MQGEASALVASEKPRQPSSPSLERAEHGLSPSAPPPPHRESSSSHGAPYAEHDGMARFWARFKGRGRKKVGWADSAKAIVFSSCTPPVVSEPASSLIGVWVQG